jgi:hypothetical protein
MVLENSKNSNITGGENNIDSNNSIDSLISSDTHIITDESEIYNIDSNGRYTKYKNTESTNNNLTLSELTKAVDKIRSSNISTHSNIPSNISTHSNIPSNVSSNNNIASSLMDIMSLNNSISNGSSDNFFHSEGIGVGGSINYLSSN